MAPYRLPAYSPGVNLAGAEFEGGGIPGRYGYDYSYPTTADVDYVVGKGLRLVRVPFRWKRLQRELRAPLDADELERLTTLVDYVLSKGASVLLDTHDYAGRDGKIGGDDPGAPTNQDFADYWSRIATVFADRPKVVFGVMNEPSGLGTQQWLAAANAAIAGIRTAGAKNTLAIPGTRWTGAHSWYSGDETSNAAVMGGVVDPLDNYVYEMHQYLDSDSSGTHAECTSATVGRERLERATTWLRERGRRAVLGEVGVGSDATCLAALDDMLTFMDQNRDVWAGWTYWAAGSRWPDTYFASVQPIQATGQERPQMSVLVEHLE